MLEPLSVISLASSVIQFIDFSSKVVSGTVQLYHSADGALPWLTELEFVIDDLSNLSVDLDASLPIDARTSPQEKELRNLALRCKALTNEFLSALRSLKRDGPSKHGMHKRASSSKWASFRQALRSVWKDQQIREYNKKLSELRQQLLLRLTAVLGDRQSSVVSVLEKISTSCREHEIQSKATLESMKSQIIAEIRRLQADDNLQTSLDNVNEKLTRLIDLSENMTKQIKILASLKFHRMRQRYSNVADAFSNTFEWVFSQETTENETSIYFKNWLLSGDGIFWICGKAGSGKSTLMKFLFEHSSTAKYLKEWAGHRSIVTEHFFFWNSGSNMQKSQEGLLRSILYGILRKIPDLIPIICETRWQDDFALELDAEFWTRAELLKALARISPLVNSSTWFCLFIDGLDEYDGDHQDILEILKKLSCAPGIKICLSRRPWDIFEKAFGHERRAILLLHELTRQDILLYVKEAFEEDIDVKTKFKEEKQFQEFSSSVVERAQGVFLWVFLVIRSLCRGARQGDNLTDLQRRLSEVPSDLETYFHHMLDGVEKVYRAEAARIFRICLAAPEPPSVITVSYFNRLETGFELDHIPTKRYSYEETLTCLKTAQTRINVRCRDLLEFRNSESGDCLPDDLRYPKVEFLHRTVRDFLETIEMRNFLTVRASLDFDADEYLANSYVAQMYSYAFPSQPEVYKALMDDLLYHAHRIEIKTKSEVGYLLDAIQKTVPDGTPPVLQCDISKICVTGNWTLALAVQRGLFLTVSERLSMLNRTSYDVDSITYPSLLHLSLATPQTSKYHWDTDVHIISCLLEAGANPNFKIGTSTAWERFLVMQAKKRRSPSCTCSPSECYERDVKILELMINGGADRKVKIRVGTRGTATFEGRGIRYPIYQDAESIITSKCSIADSNRLVHLMKLNTYLRSGDEGLVVDESNSYTSWFNLKHWLGWT